MPREAAGGRGIIGRPGVSPRAGTSKSPSSREGAGRSGLLTLSSSSVARMRARGWLVNGCWGDRGHGAETGRQMVPPESPLLSNAACPISPPPNPPQRHTTSQPLATHTAPSSPTPHAPISLPRHFTACPPLQYSPPYSPQLLPHHPQCLPHSSFQLPPCSATTPFRRFTCNSFSAVGLFLGFLVRASLRKWWNSGDLGGAQRGNQQIPLGPSGDPPALPSPPNSLSLLKQNPHPPTPAFLPHSL